jgi:hypothetical protein
MLGVYAGSLYLDRFLGLDNHLVPKLGFHTLLLLVYAGLVGLLMIPAWRVAQRAGQEEESLAAEKNKVPVVLPLDGVIAKTDDSAIQIKNKETEASDKTFPKLIDTPEDEE